MTAIRAGDYYLFEDDVTTKWTPAVKNPTTLDIGVGAEKGPVETPNPLQV